MNATPTKTKKNIDENVHTSLSKEALKSDFLDNLFYVQGKFPALATQYDYYLALAYTVRDRLLHRWISTAETYTREKVRTVAYFSAEFLLGPHLGNNLLNLGITEPVRQVSGLFFGFYGDLGNSDTGVWHPL